jgi:hypothetical protein
VPSLTIADVQAGIIDRVGDIDPVTLKPTVANTGLLAVRMPRVWVHWNAMAFRAPGLQEAYAERECIQIVLSRLRIRVDWNTGQALAMKMSQQVAALEAMLKEANAHIQKIEEDARLGARAGGATGRLIHVEPIEPPTQFPDPMLPVDANDPRFTGSPYYSTPERPL